MQEPMPSAGMIAQETATSILPSYAALSHQFVKATNYYLGVSFFLELIVEALPGSFIRIRNSNL